jgi:hypothetical protein
MAGTEEGMVGAARWVGAALAACLLAGSAAVPAAAGRPTRADLEAARRRVAVLAAEHALAATRKPYLVLDLGEGTLRHALLGMDLERADLAPIEARGLVPARGRAASEPARLAGIVTLREKENDPRLKPLTPEQIEAGLADENVADVMPPEVPADYRLAFRQRLVVRVDAWPGSGVAGVLTAGVRVWRRLAGAAAGRGDPDALRLVLHTDAATARDVYRSLIPGQHLLVVPPAGLVLPSFGQEPPGALRPAKPAPRPAPQPAPGPGVPFRIPPPVEGVEDAPPGGDAPAGAPRRPEPAPGSPPGEGLPPAGDRPAGPPPAGRPTASDQPEGEPPEGEPPAGAGSPEETREETPLPDDWEEVEEGDPPAG